MNEKLLESASGVWTVAVGGAEATVHLSNGALL